MLVTYKATHQMLELVLPKQRECCEIRIELMVRDGRFMPEWVPSDAHSPIISSLSRQEPRHSHRSHRQGSWSTSSLQDTIDEIVRGHMALMDKIAKEKREFWSQFGQTTLLDPAPTPCHSGSASGIAPRNENPSLVLSAAEVKVSKPKTRSLLDRVTMTRPYASTGSVEPEHLLTTPREWIGNVSQAVLSLGAPTVFREQSCRTVLIREPPNGSSPSDDKLSDEVIRPTHALFLASLQQANPQGRNGPQTPSQDIRKVSTAKAWSSPERVQMTRSKTTPSPAVSDSPPLSSRFMKNLLRSAREPLDIGPRPNKSSLKMVSSISRPLSVPSLSVHAKAREL